MGPTAPALRGPLRRLSSFAVLPALPQLPQGLQGLCKGFGAGGGIAPQDAQGLAVAPGGAGADGRLPVPEPVQQLLDRLRDREASIRARTARCYRQSLRILRGNPSASAKAFAEALESLRKLGERREDGE